MFHDNHSNQSNPIQIEVSRPRRLALQLPLAGLVTSALSACGANIAIGDFGSICASNSPYLGSPVRAQIPETAWPQAPTARDFETLLPNANRLNDLARSIFETQRGVGLDIAVTQPSRGRWGIRIGERNATQREEIDDATEFWWASVGKVATATLALIAENRGQLSLTDRVSRWLPNVAHSGAVSVAQLLDHTSGLVTYNHPDFGNPSQGDYQTPSQLLDRVATRPLLFCPGSAYGYTNTGYLVLALIAEAIWRAPFHEIVANEFARPLALTHFRALMPRETPANFAMPHTDARVPSPVRGLSSLVGAGNIVASASDMLQFWVAAGTDRLVGLSRTRQRWRTLYPMGFSERLWYGEGVMASDFRDARGGERLWLLHSGGGANSNAIVAWDTRHRAYIAVAANSTLPTAAVALALLDALDA